MKSWREVLISDVHLPYHDKKMWRNFKRFMKDFKPDGLTLDGDLFDLGEVSSYPGESGKEMKVIPGVRVGVKELNQVASYAKRTRFLQGNHEDRWERYLLGNMPAVMDGAMGLTFREQCYAQGLSTDIEWHKESVDMIGLRHGPFLIRHGHLQASRFGGKHICANYLMKGNGVSLIFGHHHRAQLFCQTANGVNAIAISNPCMTPPHNYAGSTPDWQSGFCILETWADKCTPHLIVASNGEFAWNGKVYA